ncbi:uncharacterized protein RHOBADRAFT_26794 [Rhodotorula graminis WP1]|uniref:Large ribosomal subunit protein bL21m n=1 Tax=Rhodotorula graminis (strain WP1) TaxID=578459 RepID=A0A194S7S8_RHOGW|nr:uncharacterized protein RHOBADRAFT_26794 [Rhodotorula graminis WP1]KPV75461.1 hypothetical protein RHOBADRAFT_26794 [Rhodotorula graminis WP1]
MLARTAASSSRWIASTSTSSCLACSTLPPRPAALWSTPSSSRAFSHATSPRRAPTPSSTSLPPPLPHHAHRNALEPQPLPTHSTSSSEPSALSLLASQPSHYVVALFMGRRYLLTPGDILTVPKLKGLDVGHTLALTRILEVGSRDYTLRAAQPASHPLATRHPDSLPHLAADTVQCTLTVTEHTKGTMFEVDKFKRRKGYRRTLRSKLAFTRLRVGEITLGPPKA